MNVDPKTNKGDIIASVYAKPGTFAEIARRFDNVSQYAVFSYVVPIIDKLADDGYLRKCKNGMVYARKKGIGPFRAIEKREECRQKDMGTLLRAGFDYDIVQNVLSYDV